MRVSGSRQLCVAVLVGFHYSVRRYCDTSCSLVCARACVSSFVNDRKSMMHDDDLVAVQIRRSRTTSWTTLRCCRRKTLNECPSTTFQTSRVHPTRSTVSARRCLATSRCCLHPLNRTLVAFIVFSCPLLITVYEIVHSESMRQFVSS